MASFLFKTEEGSACSCLTYAEFSLDDSWEIPSIKQPSTTYNLQNLKKWM